jgi:1,4-alpha-glucan branching enzyme
MQRYEEVSLTDASKPVWNYTLFEKHDLDDFQHGAFYRMYEKFGAHALRVHEQWGIYFAVWAPAAGMVSVIGNFNHWRKYEHVLFPRQDQSGIWEGFIPGLAMGELYKYHIRNDHGKEMDKGDPFANFWEGRPGTASITWDLQHDWKDESWMKKRKRHNATDAPWSIYEVHAGSWKRSEDAFLSYREMLRQLVPYVKEMGYTHVQFMPVMEHAHDGSWGYQCTGFFAPTSRFGSPQDFMLLVEGFHREGIGVILDWSPAHFAYDAHGLFMFDGTHLYEHEDLRKGYHPDWRSPAFDYGKGEVRSFLISNAIFWLDKFHVDGIRMDSVTSMLKLNYSRSDGEWEPNVSGSHENLEAINFIRNLNETIYSNYPDVQAIAQESTDWPGVTAPVTAGGLGFGMKWMMGWTYDTIEYFRLDPLFRSYKQDQLTFSMMYFRNERFLLPLGHDEVVYGETPMLLKMPGDEWQKFANLRLLYTYMFTHPGAKLMFMGNEFGANAAWDHSAALPWNLLEWPSHQMLQDCVKDILHLFKKEPAFYEKQFSPDGFEFLDLDHRGESVISYRLKGTDPNAELVVILNLTPVPRRNWKIQLKGKRSWKEIFNSDDKKYWGAGMVYNPYFETKKLFNDDRFLEVTVHLPPLGAVILK